MNSALFIFLILLICLVISVVIGRKMVVEKMTTNDINIVDTNDDNFDVTNLTNISQPLLFNGIDTNGNKTGRNIQLLHNNDLDTYSFILKDKNTDQVFNLNGDKKIVDPKIINKILNEDIENNEVEWFVQSNNPNNIVYMIKYKCNLYMGVNTDTINYFTNISELPNVDRIKSTGNLNLDMKLLLDNYAKKQMKNTNTSKSCGGNGCCGGKGCCGNCPNCNCPNCDKKYNIGSNGGGGDSTDPQSTLPYSISGNSTDIKQSYSDSTDPQSTVPYSISGSDSNESTTSSYSNDSSQYNMDKYILKTSIFPIDCPNCITIDGTTTQTNFNISGNTTSIPTLNANITIPSITTMSASTISSFFTKSPEMTEISTDNSDKKSGNDSPYKADGVANALNYFGSLPDRGTSNFIPFTNSFASFGK